MRRAYKFRIYPNRSQRRELETMLETHRRLYNACLDQRKTAYAEEQRSVNYPEQSTWFKTQRQSNPYFARVNFSSAQATMRRLDKGFKAFFRRVKAGDTPGYPRFKGKHRFDSIEFPAYGDGIRLTARRLRVQHVGTIRVNVHRAVEGTVKTASLKREAECWYLVLSCDLGAVDIPMSTLPPIGIDLGLESFLRTSDDAPEPNPRYLKAELPALRRLSRAASRTKRGGSNRRKAVRRLRALHARVSNLRREHHHTVALKLIRRFGLIAVERLNIQGMLKNRRLSRAIADAGWSAFIGTLRCKAEKAGVVIEDVDPRHTSQLCSACGRLVPKPLSQRWHSCPCGCSLHRDTNAARNILARALRARTGLMGAKLGVA